MRGEAYLQWENDNITIIVATEIAELLARPLLVWHIIDTANGMFRNANNNSDYFIRAISNRRTWINLNARFKKKITAW